MYLSERISLSKSLSLTASPICFLFLSRIFVKTDLRKVSNASSSFKGLGNCRVYHFSSISLRKKAWNNGAKTFLLKWGISIKFFKKYYLRSDTNFNGLLDEPHKSFFYYLNLIKCKTSYIYLKLLKEV